MALPVPLLADVLLRPDVWRGDRLALPAGEGAASGFPELDAELPGGGWPHGTLTELLCAQQGVGELSLLLPLLAQQSQTGWLGLVSPPHGPHAPAWAAAGVALDRLWLVRTEAARDAAWATEQMIASGALSVVLAWLPQADAYSLRRLQLAAEGQRTLAFVFRPEASAAQASPAPLRLQLAAGAGGRLAVRLLKRRGPPCQRTLALPVARPLAPRAATQRETVANPALPRLFQAV